MKGTKYDLNIGNVRQWREEGELQKWTERRTRVWQEMRAAGERATRKPDNYAERWVTAGKCLYATTIILGGAFLFDVIYCVIQAFWTGRVDEILKHIMTSN